MNDTLQELSERVGYLIERREAIRAVRRELSQNLGIAFGYRRELLDLSGEHFDTCQRELDDICRKLAATAKETAS